MTGAAASRAGTLLALALSCAVAPAGRADCSPGETPKCLAWGLDEAACSRFVAVRLGLVPRLTDVASREGDPPYTHCAAEGDVCKCHGLARYGTAGATPEVFSPPQAVSGRVACSNTVFGDPIVGATKTCQCQGSATFGWMGGPYGYGHLSFNGNKSMFLDAGPRTFDIATNGGWTAIAVLRFTGEVAAFQRVIDFASGPGIDNLMIFRDGDTANLRALLRNGVAGACDVVYPGVIVQDSWMSVVVRYSSNSQTIELGIDGRTTTGEQLTSPGGKSVSECGNLQVGSVQFHAGSDGRYLSFNCLELTWENFVGGSLDTAVFIERTREVRMIRVWQGPFDSVPGVQSTFDCHARIHPLGDSGAGDWQEGDLVVNAACGRHGSVSSACSSAVVDRTISMPWVAKMHWSHDEFFNGDIAGLLVVDEYLEDSASTAIIHAILLGQDLTGSCTSCTAGKYSDTGRATACEDCPADTYQDQTGASACQECTNAWSPVGSTSVSSCSCSEGYVQQWSGCVSCEGGKFKPLANALTHPNPFKIGRFDSHRYQDTVILVRTTFPTAPGCLWEAGGSSIGAFIGIVDQTAGPSPGPGCDDSKCSSQGGDCCAPLAVNEAATCTDSFIPIRTGVGCWTASEGEYRCCPAIPTFRVQAGESGVVSDVSDQDTAVISIPLPDSRIPQDGTMHEIILAISVEQHSISLMIDGIMIATERSVSPFPDNKWAGTDTSCIGIGCDDIPAGGTEEAWQGVFAGEMHFWLSSEDFSTFQGPGIANCSVCLAGSFSVSSATVCLECPAGTYSANMSSACSDCPSGSFSTVVRATSSSFCMNCTSNSSSPPGSDSPLDCRCNRGYSGPDGGACAACVSGQYKLSIGPAPCEDCASGKYSTTPASTTSSNCLDCSAGKFSSGTAQSSADTCVLCATRSTSPPGSAAITSCQCYSGFAGPNGGNCSACKVGSFKDSQGPAPCALCPAGTFSTVLNASQCHDCPAYTSSQQGSSSMAQCLCNVGYTGPHGGPCLACLPGLYKDSNGSAPCSLCERGKYNNDTGMTSDSACLACPTFSDSPNGNGVIFNCSCNRGYTGPQGRACTVCSAGTYKNLTGAAPCTQCRKGTYSAQLGAGSGTTCLDCPAHSTSPQGSPGRDSCTCNKGYTGASGGACTACPHGKWKGNIGSGPCSLCARGKFGNQTGKTSPSACVSCPNFTSSEAGSYHLENCTCNQGYTGTWPLCAECKSGKYKASPGSQACSQCPDGTYSTRMAATSRFQCLDCNATEISFYLTYPYEFNFSTNNTDNTQCINTRDAEAVMLAQQTSTVLSGVIAGAVAAAVAAAVAGAVAGGAGGGGSGGGGGGGGGVMQLIEQTQFMTVVGSVGGSNASAGNRAFSEGFGWANFDLLSTDDPNSRRSDDEDSDVYACSMATKGGVVAELLKRIATTVAVLSAVFSVRASLRAFQMFLYPDDPAPPDMMFPGWEGPVAVAQLFGMADCLSACLRVRCWSWRIFAGGVLVCGPLAFLCTAIFKVHQLVARNRKLKSAGLIFNDSKLHSLPEMWHGLRKVPGGVKAKGAQCFVYLMEIRFQGAWAKKDDEARYWGFLMSAYTDKFWLIIGWVLFKKLFSAVNKRLLDGSYNAVINIIIYSIDFLIFFIQRPFRDNMVNMSQVLAASANLTAIILAALPMLLPAHLVPNWLSGPIVMIVTTIGTAILTLAAALDPIFAALGAVTAFGGQVFKCCGFGGMCGRFLGTTNNALIIRFQKIFLARGKKAAVDHVKAAREEAEAQALAQRDGGASLELLQAAFQGVVQKRGHHNTHFRERLFVLDKGVLKYYKVENMVIVDGMYCTGTSVPRGSISCSGLQVQKLTAVWHRHTDTKDDSEGFHFVLTEPNGRQTECKTKAEDTRLSWIRSLTKAAKALEKMKSFTHSASGLRWASVGLTKPAQGQELSNNVLSASLQSKTEFTQREWDNFGVKDLRSDDYIKAGDCYYRPRDDDNDNAYVGLPLPFAPFSLEHPSPLHFTPGPQHVQMSQAPELANVVGLAVSALDAEPDSFPPKSSTSLALDRLQAQDAEIKHLKALLAQSRGQAGERQVPTNWDQPLRGVPSHQAFSPAFVQLGLLSTTPTVSSTSTPRGHVLHLASREPTAVEADIVFSNRGTEARLTHQSRDLYDSVL